MSGVLVQTHEYRSHTSDTVSLAKELGISDTELIEVSAGPYSGRLLISGTAMQKYREQLLAMGFAEVQDSPFVRMRKNDMTVSAQVKT